MSHSLISSGVAGRPKSKASAGDISMPKAIMPAKSVLLCQHIANPPISVDAPGLLRVVVKQRIGPHRRDERFSIRLDVAFVVGRAANDLCGLAVPGPIELESCLRFRQQGLIELCLFPAFGAIGRDLYLRDLAV